MSALGPGAETARLLLEAGAIRVSREQPFVLAIRSNEKLWSQLGGRLGQHTAAELTQALPKNAWQRLSAGAGSKGERFYNWARLRLTRLQQPPWEHWLLVRRSRKDPDSAVNATS